MHVVAARMQQGVEGEVRTLGQVVATATPGDRLAIDYRQVGSLLRVQTDADRSRLLERFQVSLEALVAHQTARVFGECKR